MLIVSSVNKVPIRLTDERWGHITARHPEVESLKNQVLSCVTKPDLVLAGDSGDLLAVRKSANHYLVVAYRELSPFDGFILTAYIARQYSPRREVIWKRLKS